MQSLSNYLRLNSFYKTKVLAPCLIQYQSSWTVIWNLNEKNNKNTFNDNMHTDFKILAEIY